MKMLLAAALAAALCACAVGKDDMQVYTEQHGHTLGLTSSPCTNGTGDFYAVRYEFGDVGGTWGCWKANPEGTTILVNWPDIGPTVYDKTLFKRVEQKNQSPITFK